MIALHHLLDPSAIALNQFQAVKHIGNDRVSGLGYAAFDVHQGQPFYQTTQGDKLHPVIVDVDNDAAGIIVITMYHRVQQSLAQRLLRVVGVVDPPQAVKGGAKVVVQRQEGKGIVHLLQDRAGKLLAGLELRFSRPLVYGTADDVSALVREQQSGIGVVPVHINQAQCALMGVVKGDLALLEGFFRIGKGQFLIHRPSLVKSSPIALPEHLTDSFIGGRDRGYTMAHKDAGWLEALVRQMVGTL